MTPSSPATSRTLHLADELRTSDQLHHFQGRYRCGIAWRDLPVRFGPWQTVWKRHARFSRDGTWDKVLAAVIAQADAAGDVDWAVSVDSTVNRAHQHVTNLPRAEIPTGGIGELHETGLRTTRRAA